MPKGSGSNLTLKDMAACSIAITTIFPIKGRIFTPKSFNPNTVIRNSSGMDANRTISKGMISIVSTSDTVQFNRWAFL
ncbi:MAG: hypothetical protein AAGU75_20375 [Bacillota bacterium]